MQNNIHNNKKNIVDSLKKMTPKKKALYIGAVVFLSFVFWYTFLNDNKKVIEKTAPDIRQVELISLDDVKTPDDIVTLSGIVESQSQAIIKSESSGRLIKVSKALGDSVKAGEVIGLFENSTERAAVTQAEGAYEQAKAARRLIQINLNNSNSGSNLLTAQDSVLNIMNASYATMDDVVRSKTDSVYSDARNANPKLLVVAPNQSLITSLEAKRVTIEKLLNQRQQTNALLSVNADLTLEMDKLTEELTLIKNYLDDLSQIYSIAIPTNNFTQGEIESQKNIVGNSRSAIIQSISTINSTKQLLTNAQKNNTVTNEGKDSSLAQSDASVKIALGSYQAALARLSKTVISSPIDGTLNSLTIKTGDFVGQNQVVAIVSNNNALVVKTNVSSEEAKNIYTGQKVLLNNKAEGRVSRVASAIDPTTNKHEVEVVFEDKDKLFVNGESVRVSLIADTVGMGSVGGAENNVTKKIFIPISSIRITPMGNYIYTISSQQTLVEVKIEIGVISGDMVEVLSGMDTVTNFVKDARGLKDGLKVEVKSNT